MESPVPHRSLPLVGPTAAGVMATIAASLISFGLIAPAGDAAPGAGWNGTASSAPVWQPTSGGSAIPPQWRQQPWAHSIAPVWSAPAPAAGESAPIWRPR